MTYDYLGATPADWYQFDFVLGLGENLLPCVPFSPTLAVVAGSALEGKVGKIPSQFNAAGLAHGLKEWQKRTILPNEIALWSKDRRLNICVRTGPISGVYAFDVDIDDARALVVEGLIDEALGATAFKRMRNNSHKVLIPFLMDEPCKKRKIKLDDSPRGPAIELLADGQQFVAAGTHSSGVRYQWQPELPTHLPVMTLAQLDPLWTMLEQKYAATKPSVASRALVPAGPLTASDSTKATSSPSSLQAPTDSLQVRTSCTEDEWKELLDALVSLKPHAGDNDTWSQIGYALLSLEATRPARQLWIEFSEKAAGYTEGAPETWWEQHHRQQTRTDYRHIFTLARQRGWGAVSDPSVFGTAAADPGKATNPRTSGPGDQPRSGPADDGAVGPVEPVRQDGPAGLDVVPSEVTQPIIRLVAKDFSKIIDQLEIAAREEMYKQGGALVTLDVGHDADEIERDKQQIMLVRITKAFARKRLGEIVRWEKYGINGWAETGPSAEHINTFIEQGQWRLLRPLDAIARAPFVRKDGSICDTEGYDKASRALLLPSAKFPNIPRSPSKSDAEAALGRLRGVFHQFPWATDAAESGFLAHVLSEAGRLAVNKCPMFFYNAPTAGTGKTLLQKAASIIAHGSVPALRPWIGDGDEIRKTVYASLLAGDRSLLFDNVPDGVKIRSAELCAAITAEVWQDRKLGESESRGVPNRAVFSASGNNVTPTGDLSRRSIIIRLDANTERLAQRRFDIEDLESYLVRERPSLLVDALTVIRAYSLAGEQITMPVPLPSFEQWSRFVREPLLWLGMPDPVDTQRNDANEDAENLATAFALLHARFNGNDFAGVDIARAAGGIADQNGQLTNAMISAGCKEPNSPHTVGYWLRGNRDKVFGGMKLVAGTHTMSGMKWHFVKVE